MNQSSTLYSYECTVPAAASETAGWKKAGILFQEHLPLLEVMIDFENGILRMKGCRSYINGSAKPDSMDGLTGYADWVVIDARMDRACPVQMNELSPAGLVMAVEGSIVTDGITGSCTGVILFSKRSTKGDDARNEWRITGYLYDVWLETSEIKFSLPVFTTENEGKFYQSYMFN
ncbi:MAG: hypothetical protein GXC73_03605 [Chitinophagaceae bacterium]|nr:hypothetical protein [Chitinophagaceae bacterium]